jgi:hypothetical protein
MIDFLKQGLMRMVDVPSGKFQDAVGRMWAGQVTLHRTVHATLRKEEGFLRKK